MTPAELSLAKDKNLAASLVALKRAARTAREIAVRTNTAIVVHRPGQGVVRITASELRKAGFR